MFILHRDASRDQTIGMVGRELPTEVSIPAQLRQFHSWGADWIIYIDTFGIRATEIRGGLFLVFSAFLAPLRLPSNSAVPNFAHGSAVKGAQRHRTAP